MPTVKGRACTILGEFERAETELVGKAVILTDRKACDLPCGAFGLLGGPGTLYTPSACLRGGHRSLLQYLAHRDTKARP